jgi:hypothetical protein
MALVLQLLSHKCYINKTFEVLNYQKTATLFSRGITTFQVIWRVKAKWRGQTGKTFHLASIGMSVEIIS